MPYPSVLKRVLPETDLLEKVDPVIDRIKDALDDVRAEVRLGGSLAKQTFLRNDHDCDLFIRFDKTYVNERLPEMTEDILKRAGFPYERVHGSRDYFQMHIDGIDYEVVPVYRIESAQEQANVTDCSYLHIVWVNNKAKEIVDGVPLHDHIRLAKAFCKAQRVYGAESYIGGVSGHVLDILVLYYGGFDQFVRGVSKWNKQTIIDPEGYYKDEQAIRSSLNAAKTLAPLIVVDPIDKDRNAAAAISTEKYEMLIDACKKLAKRKDTGSFTRKPLSRTQWKRSAKNVIEILLSPLDDKKDVAGAKMRKVHEHLIRELEQHGFAIDDQFFVWEQEQGQSLLYIPQHHIDEQYVVSGPPKERKDDVKAFKAKHDDIFEKEGRVMAYATRTYTDVIAALHAILADEYCADRITGFAVEGPE